MRLVASTDEGYFLAKALLGERYSDAVLEKALLRKLSEDSMEATSRDIAMRLQKLRGVKVTETSEWLESYKAFAKSELGLNPLAGGRIEFVADGEEAGLFRSAGERFLSLYDRDTFFVSGTPSAKFKESQETVDGFINEIFDYVSQNTDPNRGAARVILELQSIAREMKIFATHARTPAQRNRVLVDFRRLQKVMDRRELSAMLTATGTEFQQQRAKEIFLQIETIANGLKTRKPFRRS